MSAKISYGESEHSQSVKTYLRWLEDSPSRELKMVVKVAQRHCPPSMQMEELIAEGNLALLMAVQESQTKEFNGSVSWYVYRKVRTHILYFIKSNRSKCLPKHEQDEIYDMDLLPSKDKDVIKEIEIREEGEAFINAINRVKFRKSEREQNIFKMIYGIEYNFPVSFDEIGNVYNIGQERTRQLTDKALLRLTWQLHNPLAFNSNHEKSKYSKRQYVSLKGIRWALDSYYH